MISSSRPVKLTGWKREEADLFGIVERELDDAAHLLVVDAVHDGGDGHDLNAGLVKIVDGLQFYVEEVADFAMRVGGVADAVELEVDVTKTSLSGGAAELLRLREFDAV